MTRWIAKLGRGVLVAGTSAALGFGALAVVAPVPEASASHCNQGQCDGSCRSTGAQYGYCDSVGCVCVM